MPVRALGRPDRRPPVERPSWMSLSGEALPQGRVEQHRSLPTYLPPVLPHAHGPAKPSQIPMKAPLGAILPYFTDEERQAWHGEALCLSPPEMTISWLCSVPHPTGPLGTAKVTLLTQHHYHPHSTSEKAEACVSRQLAQDYTAHLTWFYLNPSSTAQYRSS